MKPSSSEYELDFFRKNNLPKEDGFRMPAEFEPHARTWMIWPERTDIWPFGAKKAQQLYTNIAKEIANFEDVTMCVSSQQFNNARRQLPKNVRVIEMSSNGAWMRDTGPTFLVNNHGEVRGIDWRFNAWGGLQDGHYYPWDEDDQIPQKVLEIEGIHRYFCDMVNEGGGIHVDGEGTLLIVESCILNENRNPGLSRSTVEQQLINYLNLEKIIWLPQGFDQDVTGGHIDNLCCFIKPGVIALTWTDDKNDPQYAISHETFDLLSHQTDAQGRTFTIHKIKHPPPLYPQKNDLFGLDKTNNELVEILNQRLPATYINYYVFNGAVLVPQYGTKEDFQALNNLRNIYPNRKVIGIDSRDLLIGGGNIHCIVNQQPKGIGTQLSK